MNPTSVLSILKCHIKGLKSLYVFYRNILKSLGYLQRFSFMDTKHNNNYSIFAALSTVVDIFSFTMVKDFDYSESNIA